jgi:putative peptidoglycan lipid II flippase
VHAIFYSAFYYNPISSAAALLVGGLGAVVLYVLVARRLRVSEVETLHRTVMARLPGRVSN